MVAIAHKSVILNQPALWQSYSSSYLVLELKLLKDWGINQRDGLWLSMLAALLNSRNSVPGTHIWQLKTTSCSNYWGMMPSSGLFRHHMHTSIHAYIQEK